MKAVVHLYTLLILLLSSGLSVAQQLTQTVTGQVVDAISQQPIPGATVTVLDTEPLLGTVTNAEGKFTISEVPVGRQDIRIMFIGYESVLQQGVLITTARAFRLDVKMEESVESLEEVIVIAGSDKRPLNEAAKVSARSFSLEEATRFAGGLSDPARVAYSFAGVTFGAPQDNGVVVRGNSPTNVLWRIEGVEVPGAAHFGGGNLAGAGLISIYSANVLGTSDFLTGAFPAEYGNVTSGVFDINFRKGSTDEVKYTAQLGILAADLAVEGSLDKDKNASFLVNYRHGFIGYYGRLAGGVAPDYQDLSYKLHLSTEKTGTFTWWGIGGLSAIFTPHGEYEVEEEDGEIEIERRETEGDFQQDDIDFDMAATGINHQLPLGKRSLLNSSLAFTTNGYNSITEWFDPESDTSNVGTLTPYTDLESRESKYTFTTNLSHKFSSRLSNQTGIIVDYLDFTARARQADDPMEPLEEFLDVSGNTYYLQAYTQSDYQISPTLSLQTGLSLAYFGINEEATLEPRAGLSWQARPALTFGLGYGRHSRREDLKVYFFNYEDDNGNIRANEDLKRSKADHYVASVNWNITSTLRFQVEAYYQRLFDVPVVPDSSYSFANYTQLWELDEQLTNEGTGTNQGVDVTLEQSFRNNYYYLLTASVFDSKYVGGDGIERNTLFNRGYLSTLTAGKEFVIRRKRKNRLNLLGFNVNLNYLGGQRITPFLPEESLREEEAILDYDQLYSNQTEPELWINAGITYRINRQNSTTTWGLDFQNATLNEQLQGYEYNFFTQEVQEERVLFLLPNLYYKLEF